MNTRGLGTQLKTYNHYLSTKTELWYFFCSISQGWGGWQWSSLKCYWFLEYFEIACQFIVNRVWWILMTFLKLLNIDIHLSRFFSSCNSYHCCMKWMYLQTSVNKDLLYMKLVSKCKWICWYEYFLALWKGGNYWLINLILIYINNLILMIIIAWY